MRNEIEALYENDIGIAFLWKEKALLKRQKIQLIFRDTGFLLTKKELHQFSEHIQNAIQTQPMCPDCKENENCRALLLETPLPRISFAISAKELLEVQELVDGTLFQLNLEGYLNNICGM